jgi:hypothetical protein
MLVRSSAVKFETVAGKIWATLEGQRCLEKDKILKASQLNENEFYAGIGWLARENKIFEEDEDHYGLGTTNLTSKIGINAGRVWKVMDIWGEVNISTMGRLADMGEKEIYSALGWLAKEDKIYINEKQMYDLK